MSPDNRLIPFRSPLLDDASGIQPPHSAGPGWNDPPAAALLNTVAKKSVLTKPTASITDPIMQPLMQPQQQPDPYGMQQHQQ